MATQALAETLAETRFEPEVTPSERYEEQEHEDEQAVAILKGGTELASYKRVATRFFPRRVAETHCAETAELTSTSCMDVAKPPGRDRSEVIADQRVRLLAREYVVGATPELDARIEILTARLNEVLPPVTEDQWQALGEIAETLKGVKSRREAIREHFGLE